MTQLEDRSATLAGRACFLLIGLLALSCMLEGARAEGEGRRG